jgi:hypothetical protein
MYNISRMPRVFTTRRTMNQIGLFNRDDFQSARPFQTSDQIARDTIAMVGSDW